MTAMQLTLDAWRNSDPETSRLAAGEAARNADTLRAACLHVLRARGPLTDFELAEALAEVGVPCAGQTSAGKRRGELRDMGLVVAAVDGDGRPVRRPSPSGSLAQVWQAVPEVAPDA